MLDWVFLVIVVLLVVIDLVMTVRGKPLFKPGPIAKFLHTGLRDDDGYL